MKNEERVWQETFVVPECLGKSGLAYKIAAIEAEGYQIKNITVGKIAQPGSLATPNASNYGETEPGWKIWAEKKK